MENDIAARTSLLASLQVRDVADNQFNARRQPISPAIHETVKNTHPFTAGEKSLHKVAPDEASPASHEEKTA
jgi:hypothetical protein